MSPLIFPCRPRARQRGAIGITAALTMALALLCTLVVVDSGRLYIEKRSLQRVADMAALEAMGLNGNCSGTSSANTFAVASATRNGFTVTDTSRTLKTLCGTLTTGSDSRRSFVADASASTAIQVTVVHTVPRSIAADIGAMFDSVTTADISLSAVAVAAKLLPPLAQLSIRSTLASVNIDQTKAGTLSTDLSLLLGSQVSLDAVSWRGLVDSDVNLLKFADQLAVALNVTAGNYTQLLATSTSVSTLLSASITALQLGESSTSVTAAITGLTTLQTALKGTTAGSTLVKLSDLVSVQTGTPSAALDTGLQAFQLVQTLAQLANGNNAGAVSQSISLPGLVNVTAKVKVVEPPQLSAVGNPLLAKAAPTGVNQIYVRTAQVRALVSINLPILNTVSGLTNAVSGLTGAITSTLNSVLHLDLTAALCLLGQRCTLTDPLLLPTGPSIDLGIELASASSYVTDVDCTTDATKTLTTQTNTALATVRAGKINETSFFSTTSAASVSPLAVVDIGTKVCTNLLGILGNCDARKPYAQGGLGLTLNTSGVGNASPVTYVFPQPPELTKPALIQTFSNTNLINSISTTLAGVSINQYGPNSTSDGLGSLLSTTAGTFSGVANLLGTVVSSTLSPVLDPLINTLLANMGIDVAKVNVGANLSCHPGQAQLVI